jgi:hypothetical protein
MRTRVLAAIALTGICAFVWWSDRDMEVTKFEGFDGPYYAGRDLAVEAETLAATEAR